MAPSSPLICMAARYVMPKEPWPSTLRISYLYVLPCSRVPAASVLSLMMGLVEEGVAKFGES